MVTNCITGFNPYAYNPSVDLVDLDYSAYPNFGGSVFGCPAGYNSEAAFANMSDYQKNYNQLHTNQYKNTRNSDLQVNGPMESIQNAAVNLKDKILKNEQDQIPQAYDAYIKSVEEAYGEGSAEVIKARALSLYSKMNNGVSLVEDIRQNSNNSITQGFLNTATFGLFYRNSG